MLTVIVAVLLFAVSVALSAPVLNAPARVTATIPEYRECVVLSWNPLCVEVQANAPWVLVVTTDVGQSVLQPSGHFAGITRLWYWTDAAVTDVRLEAATWQP